MALFDTKQVRKYRYRVKEAMILIGSEAINLEPMNVSGMKVVNNYIGNVFPIFFLSLSVDDCTYHKVLKNKDNLDIRLRVQKYYTKDGKKKEYVAGDWINDTFTLIMDENDMSRSSDIDRKEDKYEKKEKKSDKTKEMNNSLELYLYRKEVATAMQSQMNEIFTECTLTSAIAWALGKAGVRNMLMSPLENGNTYKPLYIPPLTLDKLIMYLDIMYGFYKAGSVLFFGLKYSYLLNYKGGSTAYYAGERRNSTIFVPKQGDSENAQGGSVETGDTSTYYYNMEYGAVNFTNDSVTSDVIYGTNALVVNSDDGSIVSADSGATVKDNNNYTVMENTTANPWLGDIYTYQTSSSSNVITGSIENCDIDGIEPNKKWNIIFEDTKLTNKYNGDYFLTESTIEFTNDGGSGDFGMNVGLVLKKIGKPSSETKQM